MYIHVTFFRCFHWKSQFAPYMSFKKWELLTFLIAGVGGVNVNGNISARVLHSFRIIHTTYKLVNCFMYTSTNYSNCIVFGV